jgi:hypothetical protein
MIAFINNLGKDGGILNNVRFQAQRLALQQIFDYPMGGYQMNLGGLGQSHNTWLDMANAAGVIPFFAFTAYTLCSLCNLVKFIGNNYIFQKLLLTYFIICSFSRPPLKKGTVLWCFLTPPLRLEEVLFLAEESVNTSSILQLPPPVGPRMLGTPLGN